MFSMCQDFPGAGKTPTNAFRLQEKQIETHVSSALWYVFRQMANSDVATEGHLIPLGLAQQTLLKVLYTYWLSGKRKKKSE